MKKIPVSALKEFSKKYNLSHVCVYGYCEKDNTQYVSTYGVTKLGCDQIAQFGDKVKIAAGWTKATLGELPTRVEKYKKEVDELRKENDSLKKRLDESEYKFAVDTYESERGWGAKLLTTRKFKTKEEADKFVKEYNSENTEDVAPDYYFYAESPRRINVSD